MTSLVAPDPTRYEAWRDFLHEFGAEHVAGSGYDHSDLPLDLSKESFADYIESRSREEDTTIAPQDGRVHCAYRWIVDDSWDDGGPILGFIAIRYALNQYLFDQGGHVGYAVRPSARRQGIATAALRAGADLAKDLGVDPLLVTCDESNVASRGVIVNAGGEYDGSIHGHRRYWIGSKPWPTGPTA